MEVVSWRLLSDLEGLGYKPMPADEAVLITEDQHIYLNRI